MKLSIYLLIVFLFTTIILIMIGCKYDVAEPMWDKTTLTGIQPVITSISPSSGALPGVNIITIQGNNFRDSIVDNNVTFDATTAEVISSSNSSITVRRPNLVAVAATVKLVCTGAAIVAKMDQYRVDKVFEKFGLFADNIPLGAVSFYVDTLYVIGSDISYTTWKVTPDGQSTKLTLTGSARRFPTDVRIHNGILYWMGNNREILQVNLSTHVTSRWTQLPGGKFSKFGDFGSNNYFYAGGASTDLCIIPPNPPVSVTPTYEGEYATEEILAVRVYNGYVYVAARANTATPAKIWKHLIGTGAALGTRDPVLDMSTTGFASRLVRAISLSSTGTLYITTDAPNPILVWDGTTLDYFYKDICSHTINNNQSYWFGKQAYWGNQNYLYMIGQDTLAASAPAETWNILRFDMGTTGAPNY
jgi:hypothetical protein